MGSPRKKSSPLEEAASEGGLAAPGFTHEAKRLAFAHGEGHAVHGLDHMLAGGPGTEMFAYAAQFQKSIIVHRASTSRHDRNGG